MCLNKSAGAPVGVSNRARVTIVTVLVGAGQGDCPALRAVRPGKWRSFLQSCGLKLHLRAHHAACIASAQDCPLSSGQLRPDVPGLPRSPSHVCPHRPHQYRHRPPASEAESRGAIRVTPFSPLTPRASASCISCSGYLASTRFPHHHTTLAYSSPNPQEGRLHCLFLSVPHRAGEGFHKVDHVGPVL